MARSLEEILGVLSRSLSNRAGSPWESLSQGIVGKELLYAGANIIYATEQLSDSVNGVLELDRFGLSRLISYAYMQEVPLDLVQASQVRIQLTSKAQQEFAKNNGSNILAPFQLSVSVGSLTFYNIGYHDVSKPLTLYAGTLRSMSSSSSFMAIPFPGWSGGVSSGSWRLYLELAQGAYSSAYVKLGQSVLSNSVWVFAQNANGSGPVFPYTTYDSALVNPEALLYKVRTLWDGSTVVLFGDGNWAREVDSTLYRYTILWLEASTQSFSLNGKQQASYVCRSFGSTPIFDSSLRFSDLFTVLSTRVGQSGSEAYGRSYLAEQLFSKQGLVSEAQIYAYLRTLASVGSSYIESSLDAVDVYIKPTDPADVGFGFIEEYLYSYGVVGRSYHVRLATPIPFRIQLSGTSAAMSSVAASGVLTSLYSYDSVTLDTRLTSAVIQQSLSEAGFSGLVATIIGSYVSESTSSVISLGALPLMNSIILKRGDALLGFDSNGAFRQYVEGSEFALPAPGVDGTSYSSFGVYTYVSSPSGAYLYRLDGSRVLAMSADAIIGRRGVLTPYGDSLFGLYDADGGRFYVYVDRSSLHDTSASTGLSMNPTYIAAIGSYSVSVDSSSVASGGSVRLNKILGVFGSNGQPSYLMASVSWSESGRAAAQNGLARFRCIGSSYAFDMMLALSDSGGRLESDHASYYGGSWFALDYVAGSDSVYVVMYNDMYEQEATAVAGSKAWRLWSRSLRVQGDSAALQTLRSVLKTSGSLLGFNVISDELFVIAYLDESGSSASVKFESYLYSLAIDTGTNTSVFTVGGSTLSGSVKVPAGGSYVVFPTERGLQCVMASGGVVLSVSDFPGTSQGVDTYSSVALLTDTGSVDYSSGVLYGIVIQPGDVLSYTVASVLGDGKSYPYLVGVDY